MRQHFWRQQAHEYEKTSFMLSDMNSPKQENHSVLKTLKVVISRDHIVRVVIRIRNNFTKYLHSDNSVDVEGQHDKKHHVRKTFQSFKEDKEKGPHLSSVVQELYQTSCSEHLHQTGDHEVVLKQRGGVQITGVVVGFTRGGVVRFRGDKVGFTLG